MLEVKIKIDSVVIIKTAVLERAIKKQMQCKMEK